MNTLLTKPLSADAQILVTCGARKGFRFSSRDIVRLRGIAESLDGYYDSVDEAFRGLSSDVIRFRFPTTTRRLEDDAPNFERLQNHRKNGVCKVEDASTHNAVQHRAFQFQWLARQYIVAFARLRNAVMEIRLRLLRTTKNPPLVPKLSDLNDPGSSRGAVYWFYAYELTGSFCLLRSRSRV